MLDSPNQSVFYNSINLWVFETYFFFLQYHATFPQNLFQLSPVNAKHFLRKAIYWATVTAASFGCYCTSVNFDCKPPFCREFIFSIPRRKNVINRRTNSTAHSTPSTAWQEPGCASMRSVGSTGSDCENKFWSWNVACENYNVHHEHRKIECHYWQR